MAQVKPTLAGPAKYAADRKMLSARYSQRKIDGAYERLRWLNKWIEARRFFRHGATNRQVAERIVRQAKEIEGDKFRISVRTLQFWERRFFRGVRRGRRIITGIEALIDRYGEKGHWINSRSKGAVDHFYALYKIGHTIKHCHEATLKASWKNAWSWPLGYSSTVRWVREGLHNQGGNSLN